MTLTSTFIVNVFVFSGSAMDAAEQTDDGASAEDLFNRNGDSGGGGGDFGLGVGFALSPELAQKVYTRALRVITRPAG